MFLYPTIFETNRNIFEESAAHLLYNGGTEVR